MKLGAVSHVLLLAIVVQSYCLGGGCFVCSFGSGHLQNHQTPGAPDDSATGMNHDDHDMTMAGAADEALSSIASIAAKCGASPTCNTVLSNSAVERLKLDAFAHFSPPITNVAFTHAESWGTVARGDTGPPARVLSSTSTLTVLRI